MDRILKYIYYNLKENTWGYLVYQTRKGIQWVGCLQVLLLYWNFSNRKRKGGAWKVLQKWWRSVKVSFISVLKASGTKPYWETTYQAHLQMKNRREGLNVISVTNLIKHHRYWITKSSPIQVSKMLPDQLVVTNSWAKQILFIMRNLTVL